MTNITFPQHPSPKIVFSDPFTNPRRRGESMGGEESWPSPSDLSPKSAGLAFSHVSFYQSSRMQLQLYSPSIKASFGKEKGPLAVYTTRDQVAGKVTLDRTCYHSGTLSISIEGAFKYSPTSPLADGDSDAFGMECQTPERRTHVFLASSTVIPVSPEGSSPARTTFREAFMKRRPSATSLNLNSNVVPVTLPTSITFPRGSSIPYFVVFTTTPRSPELAKEIASDATISVSLLQQISVTEQTVAPPTPPRTPSTPGDESDAPRKETPDPLDKPLPPLPSQTFTVTTTLQNRICIGFRKRPRHQLTETGGHPTLEAHASLPDGLLKDKILVPKDNLPCIDWAGLSVKYYLDVSVLVGADIYRARIPVPIS
ncbi:hypothetical protein H0H93_009064 [Arthromyces matolae]|nr:hypothetical protein H0H93_009064 [Arthromyces matolae]